MWHEFESTLIQHVKIKRCCLFGPIRRELHGETIGIAINRSYVKTGKCKSAQHNDIKNGSVANYGGFIDRYVLTWHMVIFGGELFIPRRMGASQSLPDEDVSSLNTWLLTEEGRRTDSCTHVTPTPLPRLAPAEMSVLCNVSIFAIIRLPANNWGHMIRQSSPAPWHHERAPLWCHWSDCESTDARRLQYPAKNTPNELQRDAFHGGGMPQICEKLPIICQGP